MAVADLDVPAKRAPLGALVAEGHDVVAEAVDLEAVIVHDDLEVAELVLCRAHRRLPDLAGLTFAVAEDAVGAVFRVVCAGRQRHADRHGHALTQRAGQSVDARRQLSITVLGQHAVVLVEHTQLVFSVVAEVRQNDVLRRAGVALGDHEAVAIRVLRIFCIYLQKAVVIERRHDLQHRQRAARMP